MAALLDELAGHVREMHDRARALFLVASDAMQEAKDRPERKVVADAYFEAAVQIKKEAEALGQVIERYAPGVAQFPPAVRG